MFNYAVIINEGPVPTEGSTGFSPKNCPRICVGAFIIQQFQDYLICLPPCTK